MTASLFAATCAYCGRFAGWRHSLGEAMASAALRRWAVVRTGLDDVGQPMTEVVCPTCQRVGSFIPRPAHPDADLWTTVPGAVPNRPAEAGHYERKDAPC